MIRDTAVRALFHEDTFRQAISHALDHNGICRSLIRRHPLLAGWWVSPDRRNSIRPRWFTMLMMSTTPMHCSMNWDWKIPTAMACATSRF